MTTPAPLRPSSGKRLDLQGVRALAVLLVAVNHANLHVLSGGYVGVDVFFVLSGFFITGLLLREGTTKLGARRGAKISLGDFYTRRVRRILPAATLTILVTAVAVYVVYDLLHRDYLNTKPTLTDGLAATLFYANVHFAGDSTNYFTSSATGFPSPFQHFWSLSVEEQFYLVWPAALLGLYALADRLAGRRAAPARRYSRRLIGAVLLVVLLASLYWSVRYTKANPAAAYFITFTRVWELALGSLVALAVADGARLAGQPRTLRLALGSIGLAAIAYASIAFTSRTPFPGLAALVPTLGTSALIVAGHGTARMPGVNRLLATTPLTFIGDRSYTFYLWHFPALIIVWQLAGHYTAPGVSLLILGGAFALSCVTYARFENPIRHSPRIRGWRALRTGAGLIGAASATVIGATALFTASLSRASASAVGAQRVATASPLKPAPGQPVPASLPSSEPIPAVRAAVVQVRANALPPRYFPALSSLLEKSQVQPELPAGCTPAFGPHATSKVCHLGDRASSRVIVLAGDSHAEMWAPALIKVATALHYQLVVLAKPGCFITRDLGQNPAPGWPCAQFYAWMLGEDRALHPVATLFDFISFDYPGANAKIYLNDLFQVAGQVVNPVIMGDTPNLMNGSRSIYDADCLSGMGVTMAKCAGHLPSWYPQMLATLQTRARRQGIPTLATLQWVCASRLCPPVINHTVVYRDDTHLTSEYAEQLAPLLAPAVRAALEQSSTGSGAVQR